VSPPSLSPCIKQQQRVTHSIVNHEEQPEQPYDTTQHVPPFVLRHCDWCATAATPLLRTWYQATPSKSK
jgi:hypothetical protein